MTSGLISKHSCCLESELVTNGESDGAVATLIRIFEDLGYADVVATIEYEALILVAETYGD